MWRDAHAASLSLLMYSACSLRGNALLIQSVSEEANDRGGARRGGTKAALIVSARISRSISPGAVRSRPRRQIPRSGKCNIRASLLIYRGIHSETICGPPTTTEAPFVEATCSLCFRARRNCVFVSSVRSIRFHSRAR